MPATRRSTVWDYSDLRIRLDGTRVSATDPNTTTTRQTRLPRHPTGAAQDPRGNWIARDAVGKGTVPTYRIIHSSKDENDETSGSPLEGPVRKNTQETLPSSGSKGLAHGKGKGKGRQDDATEGVGATEKILGTSSLSARRAERRRRFREDVSYLTGHNNTRHGTPLPSAELLKCIHLFTSHYYTVRGQLFDLTNDHRNLQRNLSLIAGGPGHDESEMKQGRENPLLEDQHDSNSSDSGNNDDLPETDYIDDMYRMFEGSTLMAMGMLVQEYLIKMLKIQPPDNWPDDIEEDSEHDEEGDEEVGEEDSAEEDAMDVDREPHLRQELEGLAQMSERTSKVIDLPEPESEDEEEPLKFESDSDT